MVLAGLTGCGCVVGHHIFYAALNGAAVPAGQYSIAGRSFSTQQLNFFVGTALAFLVKVFLCFAISIAYIQVFWRTLRSRELAPKLLELDWAYSALDNVLNIFDLRTARGYPFLLFLTILFWYYVKSSRQRQRMLTCR